MWVGFCIHLRCLRWSSRNGRRRWLNFSLNLAHKKDSGGVACFCRTLLYKEYKRCVVLVEIGLRPGIVPTMMHFVHALRVERVKNSNLLLSTANIAKVVTNNHVHGLEKGLAQKGEEVERLRQAFEEELCAHQELWFLKSFKPSTYYTNQSIHATIDETS